MCTTAGQLLLRGYVISKEKTNFNQKQEATSLVGWSLLQYKGGCTLTIFRLWIKLRSTEYGYVLWIVIAADTLYSVLLLLLLLLRLRHGRYEVLLAVEFGLVILVP